MQHDYSAVIEWLETQCERAALDPEGIGETIYAAADTGQVTLAEAKLLLQTVLSAGADTTFITMANALRAWAEFPRNTPGCAPSRRRSARRSTNRCAGIRRAAWPAASPRATWKLTTM
jgi:cytochrome P450